MYNRLDGRVTVILCVSLNQKSFPHYMFPDLESFIRKLRIKTGVKILVNRNLELERLGEKKRTPYVLLTLQLLII